jgi:hypothetical protein
MRAAGLFSGMIERERLLEVAGGQIRAISSIVNPDKLAHLGPVGDFGALLRSAR